MGWGEESRGGSEGGRVAKLGDNIRKGGVGKETYGWDGLGKPK